MSHESGLFSLLYVDETGALRTRERDPSSFGALADAYVVGLHASERYRVLPNREAYERFIAGLPKRRP